MARKSQDENGTVLAVQDQLDQPDTTPDLTTEELDSYTLEELVGILALFGVVLNMDRIRMEVRAAFGTYLDEIASGAVMDAAKQAEMNNRIALAVRRAALIGAKAIMGSTRLEMLRESDQRDPEMQAYVWVAKLINTCRSCEELHGEIKTMDEWDLIGKPRDGNTLCGLNCECDLVMVAANHSDTTARIDEINAQGPRRQIVQAGLDAGGA